MIKVQMMQLQSENPHLDDYYYQVSGGVGVAGPIQCLLSLEWAETSLAGWGLGFPHSFSWADPTIPRLLPSQVSSAPQDPPLHSSAPAVGVEEGACALS